MFEIQIGSSGINCFTCIPYKFLRLGLFIGVGIIFGLCLIVELGALIEKKKINNADEGDYDKDVQQSTLSYFTFYQIIVIIIVIVAIIGLIGIRQENKCLLGIFNTCNCCFFFIFALTYALISLFSAFSNFSNSYICDNTKIYEKDILYKAAAETLCKDGCECYFSGTITRNQLKYVQKYSATDKTLPVRFEQCTQSQNYNKTEIASLQQIESFYECSGWCTQYPIQYFNNVNSKINASTSCSKAIINYWDKFFGYIKIISFLLSFFFILMFIFTCFYCFYPKNSNKKMDSTKIALINQ
ncbi:unnamed protein product [Paramecium pentaurelia]|uniref:Tetraspanin family protein n=1 Tax=Paramecium pentaurelia TaxID=43138 RepID=A0A8S1VS75_9CILI|nr:unnamed protein product [Paramecium pentaurelia]